MAAGILFVLARIPGATGWTLVAPAVDVNGAQAAVLAVLTAQPASRVVVARAIRSVTATLTTADDPDPIVEP